MRRQIIFIVCTTNRIDGREILEFHKTSKHWTGENWRVAPQFILFCIMISQYIHDNLILCLYAKITISRHYQCTHMKLLRFFNSVLLIPHIKLTLLFCYAMFSKSLGCFWNSFTSGHILMASGRVPKTSITFFIIFLSYYVRYCLFVLS